MSVVVIGDSLSAAYGIDERQGWVALLRDRLQLDYPESFVLNASVTGDTTSGGLARLPKLLEQHQPDWIVLELGGNDGLRALSLKDMKNNLRKMIQLCQEAETSIILVGTPQPPHYGAAYGRRFNKVFASVAESTSVSLVPNILSGLEKNPEWLQADGIHPGVEAQPLMLENVWAVLSPLLKANGKSF